MFFIFSVYPSKGQEILWSFDTKSASYGMSAAGDIDGDGLLEIVFGCYRNDGKIYALNGDDGSLLWEYDTTLPGNDGCNDVAPLIYDIDNDGTPEIFVPSSCNPVTYCLDGKTGEVRWKTKTRGSDSPPTIGDIDNDGKLEILHGEFTGYLICIDAETGVVKWEKLIQENSWIQTAPTLSDIDYDGNLDIIVATWAFDKALNHIYALKGTDQELIWNKSINNYVYHGTTIGDLDNDGKNELYFGSYNDTLYCINAIDGSTKWTYYEGQYFTPYAAPVIADVDDDGKCEIIENMWYKTVVLNSEGIPKWKYIDEDYSYSFRGVAVADITNDNYPDIVFATDAGTIYGLSGLDGKRIFRKNLRNDYGNELYSFDNAPLIADFNKDGLMDVFIVGGWGTTDDSNNFGRAYMLSIGKGNGPNWLMFQHDALRQNNTCLNTENYTETLTKNDIVIYPNPAYNMINIRSNDEMRIKSIGFYDCFGKSLGNDLKFEKKVGNKEYQFHVTSFLNSTYTIFTKIVTDNQVIVRKILIIK